MRIIKNFGHVAFLLRANWLPEQIVCEGSIAFFMILLASLLFSRRLIESTHCKLSAVQFWITIIVICQFNAQTLNGGYWLSNFSYIDTHWIGTELYLISVPTKWRLCNPLIIMLTMRGDWNGELWLLRTGTASDSILCTCMHFGPWKRIILEVCVPNGLYPGPFVFPLRSKIRTNAKPAIKDYFFSFQ